MAHTGPQPVAVLPGIPSISDVLPGFATYEWNGVFVPAGTDTGVITRLNTEFNELIRDPGRVQRLAKICTLTKANTVAEFAAFREQQI